MEEEKDAAFWKAKGNACVESKDFNEAINCYTKAIELDQVNHILYSNRSFAYEQTGDYPKSLEDATKCVGIKCDWGKGHYRKGRALMGMLRYEEAWDALTQALSFDQGSAEIKADLLKCTNLMKKNKGAGKKKEHQQIVTMPKEDEIMLNNMLDGSPVQIKVLGGEKGRGVVAVKTIARDTLLFTATPYVSCVLYENEFSFVNCSYCLRVLNDVEEGSEAKSKIIITKCEFCDVDIYCSEECLKTAWTQYHRKLCIRKTDSTTDEVHSLATDKIHPLIRLEKHCRETRNEYPLMILRILARIIQDIESGVPPDDAWRPIGMLPCVGGFEAPASQEASMSYELDLIKELIFDPRLAPLFTLEKYKRINTKFMLNAFRVDIKSLHKSLPPCKTRALLITGSFFNHSCEPNTDWKPTHNDHRVDFISKDKIAVGKECCISYINHMLKRSERRRLLSEGYMFDCNCAKCSSGR